MGEKKVVSGKITCQPCQQQLDTGLIATVQFAFLSPLLFSSFNMSDAVPQLETIAITLFPSGVVELAFNRPQRYNALSPQAYRVSNTKRP